MSHRRLLQVPYGIGIPTVWPHHQGGHSDYQGLNRIPLNPAQRPSISHTWQYIPEAARYKPVTGPRLRWENRRVPWEGGHACVRRRYGPHCSRRLYWVIRGLTTLLGPIETSKRWRSRSKAILTDVPRLRFVLTLHSGRRIWVAVGFSVSTEPRWGKNTQRFLGCHRLGRPALTGLTSEIDPATGVFL